MLLTLDKVKYKNRGVYNPATTYQFNDAVFYNGAMYSAITDTTGNAPLIKPCIASGTRFVVTHTNTTPTAGGWRFAQTSPSTSFYDISSSTNNPTLYLSRGGTYTFDCSYLTQAQAFALFGSKVGAFVASDAIGVPGALRNNPQRGLWAESKAYNILEGHAAGSNHSADQIGTINYGQKYTLSNLVITYNVPLQGYDVNSDILYYGTPITSGATSGVIYLLQQDNVIPDSTRWAVIAKESDSQTTDTRGALSVRGASEVQTLSPGERNSPLVARRLSPTVYTLGGIGPAGGRIFLTPTSTGNSTGLYFEAAPVNWAGGSGDPRRTWTDTNSKTTYVPSPFGTNTATTKTTGEAIGHGKGNTKNIVLQTLTGQNTTSKATAAANCAAALCESVTINGFSDFFLPSKAELIVMCEYNTSYNIGLNTTDYYWASTEAGATSGQQRRPESGGTSSYNQESKDFTGDNSRIRAIRSFSPADVSLPSEVTWAPLSGGYGRVFQTSIPFPLENTTYVVTNSGTSAYSVGGVSNPTLSLKRGTTYTIQVNATGHPFWIQTSSGAYNAANVVTSGITNNGAQFGYITYQVPANAPDTLYYVCQNHSAMAGTINITGTYTTTMNGFVPLQMDYEGTSLQFTRRGFEPGLGQIFFISTDRRSLKMVGYNRYGSAGLSMQQDDEYAATDYGSSTILNYINQPQYCQFDKPFFDDEWIKFVRRNGNQTMVVTNRGRLYNCGYNGYGQLGLNDAITRRIFTLNPYFSDTQGKTIVDLWHTMTSDGNAVGQLSVHVLTAEGEIWACGYNGYYQLGDGTAINRDRWVRIGETTINRLGYKTVGMISFQNTNYEAGGIAWNSNNEIWGWGYNDSGILAQNNVSAYASPVRMTQLETLLGAGVYVKDWAWLSSDSSTQATRRMMAVLDSTGKVHTCGRSNNGQHGTGVAESTSSYVYSTITMPAGKTFAKIYCAGGAGGSFYGLTTDGYLYAWGYNGYQNLGDGTTTNRIEPVLCSAVGINGTITKFMASGWGAGGYVVCWAQNSEGKVWSWGFYSYGATCQNQVYTPTNWQTTNSPKNITNNLPYQGRGLVNFAPCWSPWNAGYTTIYLEYSNGEIFVVGYSQGTETPGDYRGDGGNTNASAINYPRLVTNQWY